LDSDLRKENESLKEIVRSMRDEMVLLADNIPTKLSNLTSDEPNKIFSKPPNKANEGKPILVVVLSSQS
jgi:hypothetical protein